MHPLPTKFPTRDKTRKFKMLKTNITQGEYFRLKSNNYGDSL